MQVPVKRSERDTPLQLRYPRWALAWVIIFGLSFLVQLSYLDDVREGEQGAYLFAMILDFALGVAIWYGITLAVGWLAHRLMREQLIATQRANAMWGDYKYRNEYEGDDHERH